MSDLQPYVSKMHSACFLTPQDGLNSIIKRKQKQNACTRNTYGTYVELALPSYHRFQAKVLRMFSGAKPMHKHGTGNKAILVITTLPFCDFGALLQKLAFLC